MDDLESRALAELRAEWFPEGATLTPEVDQALMRTFAFERIKLEIATRDRNAQIMGGRRLLYMFIRPLLQRLARREPR